MKKVFVALVVFAAIALIQSCAGSQKHCAAYAKHHTGDNPSYKEVQ